MILLAIALVLLSGCAVFTAPIYADPVAEQEACLRSLWCRTMINDRPAWTARYHSDREDCLAHASEIAEQARADGLRVTFVVGDMITTRHAVAVVQGRDGTLWAYDNGRISNTPFPPAELSHWMRRMAWFNDINQAL